MKLADLPKANNLASRIKRLQDSRERYTFADEVEKCMAASGALVVVYNMYRRVLESKGLIGKLTRDVAFDIVREVDYHGRIESYIEALTIEFENL